MKTRREKKSRKITAVILLFSQIAYILPAQSLMLEKDYSRLRLEQYLDRAARERNETDWKRIAEEGLLASMTEWESTHSYLKETDTERYEAEKKVKETELHNYSEAEYTGWYIRRKIEENNELNQTELAKKLSEKADEYRNLYAEKGADEVQAAQVREEWTAYAENTINEYIEKISIKNGNLFPEITARFRENSYSEEQLNQIYSSITETYNQRALSEYEKVYKAERNQLMAGMLYDSKSTKKLSAAQAADIIARETAKDVKSETDAVMNGLFCEFDDTVGNIEEEEIQIRQKDWLNRFQSAFEQSMRKWEAAEKEFLVKRSEWEFEAEKQYENSEKAWAEGYRLLEQKKNEWYKEINRKLEDGRKQWDKSREDLEVQLESMMDKMKATIEKEREGKEKMLDVQISIYNGARSILSMAASGLEGTAELFSEKYDGKYSYWKTEDSETLSETDEKKIDDFYNTLNLIEKTPGKFFNDNSKINQTIELVKYLETICKDREVKEILHSLNEEDGWLTYIKDYKEKALNAIGTLYALTGCIYCRDATESTEEEIFYSELDIEIIKAKAVRDYWNEEYTVAAAVSGYAQSVSAQTDTDRKTSEALNAAISEYATALQNYSDAVDSLETYEQTVKNSEKTTEEKRVLMAEAKAVADEKKKEYSQLLAVYKGAGTEALKQKLYSLLSEYREKKSADLSSAFDEYYRTLAEYDRAVFSQKKYGIKNQLTEGSENILSVSSMENYRQKAHELSENPDLSAPVKKNALKTYLSEIKRYCGSEANAVSMILMDAERELEENEGSEIKPEKTALIKNYLRLIEQYWDSEIQSRSEAVYYITNGKFKDGEKTEVSEEEKKKNRLLNYLDAVLEGKKKWETEFKKNLSSYSGAFGKIEKLKEYGEKETWSNFSKKVSEAAKEDEMLRLILQQADIYTEEGLCEWILSEYEYKNRAAESETENQKRIKAQYGMYCTAEINERHENAINQIKEYDKNHSLSELTEEGLYELSAFAEEIKDELNIYGQSALDNYLNAAAEYLAAKLAYSGSSDLNALESETENLNASLEAKINEASEYSMIQYRLTDLKSVLEIMKDERNELYLQNKELMKDYAAYLILSKLYEGDVFEKTAEELTSIICLGAVEDGDLWNDAFKALPEELKQELSERILGTFNYISDYDEYEETVNAVKDYIRITAAQDSEEYRLKFELAESGSVYKKMAQAAEEYEGDDGTWGVFYLAGEKFLMAYLLSEYGYAEKDEAVEKLGKNSKEYVKAYRKIRKAADSYIGLLDGDAEEWAKSLEGFSKEEKETVIDILNGKQLLSNYYSYEADRKNITGTAGAGRITGNNINALSATLADKAAELYRQKNLELSKLQVKLTVLNKEKEILKQDNVSWVEKLNENNITVNDSMDEKTKAVVSEYTKGYNIKETIKGEKLDNAERHYRWLTEKSSAENTDVQDKAGAADLLASKMNAAYQKYLNENNASAIVEEINSVNGSLSLAIKKIEEITAQLDEKKAQMILFQNSYTAAMQEWKNAADVLTHAVEAYNSGVNTAEEKFAELREAEQNRRIKQEIYDWAKSVYLKDMGSISDELYITPQEREADVKYSKTQAQMCLDILNEIKNGTASKNAEYNTAMTAYKTAAENHYTAIILRQETEKGIAVQEDRVRSADQKLSSAYSKYIIPVSEEFSVSDVMKLVSITKENGQYKFRIDTEKKSYNEQNTLEYFKAETYAEKIPGGERYISQALADTREWTARINANPDYADNLMLAAAYIMTSAEVTESKDYTTYALPGPCHGIDCQSLAEDCKAAVLKEAYDFVMNCGGEEDLAKYLLFVHDEKNPTGTTILFGKDQTECVLQVKVMEKLRVFAQAAHDAQVIESIALAAEAAAVSAIAGACGWPLGLIPGAIAAGLSIAAGTAAFKACIIRKDIIGALDTLTFNFNMLILSSRLRRQALTDESRKAEEECKSEWETLNIMCYGTETEDTTAPDLKKVKDAMNTRVSVLSCDYGSDIETIFTKDAYNNSGADRCKDVNDAITAVYMWYEKQKNTSQSDMETKIEKLRNSQTSAAQVYKDAAEEKAHLTEAQKKALHELALKASDETLTASERAQAKTDFENLSDSYITQNNSYKQTLKTLAQNAWGNGTWSSDLYFKDLETVSKNFYRPQKADYSQSTENYMNGAMESYKNTALLSFDRAASQRLEALSCAQDIERVQLEGRRSEWERQINVIVSLAEKEWEKAGETIVQGYTDWKNRFINEYEVKQKNWADNYSSFITRKQDWADRQYLNAVRNAGTVSAQQYDSEADRIISEALSQAETQALNISLIDPEKYTQELLAGTALSKLMGSIDSLKERGKNTAVSRKHGLKMSSSSLDSAFRAEQVMMQIEEEIEKTSAKLAAQQAQKIVENIIKASMERIDMENEGMRNWQESFAEKNGYTVSGSIIRKDIVTDSTIAGAVYEPVFITRYQDFKTSAPELKVSLSQQMLEGLNGNSIMLLVAQANSEIESWNKKIFGDETKKQKDKDKDKEEDTSPASQMRDGEFGTWVGYAPQFVSSINLQAGREANVLDYGLGQMGVIMLDFQWNAMRENQGWQMLGRPVYDQPMWKAGSGFMEPPTIRGLTSIAAEILGTVSGMQWYSYVDDLIFAAIDIGGGYKSAEEVGLELAKTAAGAALSMGISSAGSALSNLAGSALKAGSFASTVTQAGISMAQNYATSIGRSAINSFYIAPDGSLSFNRDSFGKSLYSADTIGGMVGAGVTAGLSEWNLGARSKEIITGDGKKVTQTDFTRARGFNETQIGNISRLNSLAGGLAGNAVTLAMGGNASFNILNVSDIVSMFGGEYRNGKTGAKASTGLFEVSFGKDGVTGRIGMNGTDISLGNLMLAMDGALAADKSSKINRKVTNERVANAMRSLYGFGENIEKTLLEDLLNGDAIWETGGTDGKAQTVLGEDGKRHIYLNINDDTDWKEMGLMLSHEAHRDGLKDSADEQDKETVSAVKGHTEMAKRMMSDSLYYYDMNDLISGNQNLQMDLIASTLGDEIFEKYVNGTYDSSDDYWRIISKMDGTISVEAEYDKNGNLIKDVTIEYQDENGKKIGQYKPDNQDYQNSLGQAASLSNIYGLDRMEKILGGDLNDANIYDNQTLYDIFGLEGLMEIRLTGRIPDDVTDSQKMSLAGEALLKKNGFKYDSKTWKKDEKTENVILEQHLADHVPGSLVANSFVPNKENDKATYDLSKYNVRMGGFDYLTLFEDVVRSPLSYTLNTGTQKEINKNTPYRYLDTRTIYAYDLDGNQLGDSPLVSDKWITVQTAIPSDYTKDAFIDMKISGNPLKVGPETIREGPIAYQMKIATDSSLKKQMIENGVLYMQAVYGTILAGNKIPTTGEVGLSIGRHLLHPAGIGNNYGCGVTNKENFNNYTEYLTGWGAKPGKTRYDKYGTVIFGRIRQKYVPGVFVY